MATLAGLSQVGGAIGDTFGGYEIVRVIADGRYVWQKQTAEASVSAHISDMDAHLPSAADALQFVRRNAADDGWEAVDLPVSPDNLKAGSGAPGGTVGTDGDFYLQLDAALGSNDIWGPKAAGAWPAQADAKTADPIDIPDTTIQSDAPTYGSTGLFSVQGLDLWGQSRRVQRIFDVTATFDFPALNYVDRTAIYVRNANAASGINYVYRVDNSVSLELRRADGTTEAAQSGINEFNVQPGEIVFGEKDGNTFRASIIPGERVKNFVDAAAANTFGPMPHDSIVTTRNGLIGWRKTGFNSRAFPADGLSNDDWVIMQAETLSVAHRATTESPLVNQWNIYPNGAVLGADPAPSENAFFSYSVIDDDGRIPDPITKIANATGDAWLEQAEGGSQEILPDWEPAQAYTVADTKVVGIAPTGSAPQVEGEAYILRPKADLTSGATLDFTEWQLYDVIGEYRVNGGTFRTAEFPATEVLNFIDIESESEGNVRIIPNGVTKTYRLSSVSDATFELDDNTSGKITDITGGTSQQFTIEGPAFFFHTISGLTHKITAFSGDVSTQSGALQRETLTANANAFDIAAGRWSWLSDTGVTGPVTVTLPSLATYNATQPVRGQIINTSGQTATIEANGNTVVSDSVTILEDRRKVEYYQTGPGTVMIVDEGALNGAQATYTGLQRIGAQFRPGEIEINNSRIVTGLDMTRPTGSIRLQLTDTGENGKPWPSAEIDLEEIRERGEFFIWNHDNAYISASINDLATGDITFGDFIRAARFIYAEIVDFGENGYAVPTATTSKARVNLTANSGDQVVAPAQLLEGSGAAHVIVAVPDGQMIDIPDFEAGNAMRVAAGVTAVVENALSGEIAIEVADGTGNVDLTVPFVARTPNSVYFFSHDSSDFSTAANANSLFLWTPDETDNSGILKNGAFFVAPQDGLYDFSAAAGMWNTSGSEAWATLTVDLYEPDETTQVREVSKMQSRTIEVDGTGNRSGVQLTVPGLVAMTAGQRLRPRIICTSSHQILDRSFKMILVR